MSNVLFDPNFNVVLPEMNVSQRWYKQFYVKDSWKPVHLTGAPRTSEDVYKQLVETEKNFPNDPDCIDEVLGNKSWTHHTCNTCYTQTREPLIEVSFNEYGILMCSDCLAKGIEAIDTHKKESVL